MRRSFFPFLFLAVPALAFTADLAVSIGVQQAALVVKDTRFTPGVQLQTGIEPGFSVVFSPAWRLDGLIGIGHTTPSALTLDGITYRGLTTRSVGLGLAIGGSARGGGYLKTQAILASYEGTSLLFLYPTITAGPILRMALGEATWVEWTLGISYHLRQDLVSSSALESESWLDRLPFAFSAGLTSRILVEISRPEP